MDLPGFTAEVSLYKMRMPTTCSMVIANELGRTAEVLLQIDFLGELSCTVGGGHVESVTGPCTGIGGSSSVSALGVTRTCEGWFQYPWIEYCRGGFGWGSHVINSGCGFCFS
jgi:hypothetical protein